MIEDLKNKYPLSVRLDVWIEELLELATALQKSKKGSVLESEIMDEIADVDFCIDQMKAQWDVDKIAEIKEYKMWRTKQRYLNG